MFLVLISKKGGVEGLKEFKPIGLMSGLYRLLAQMLTNGLKRWWEKRFLRLGMSW